jgi:hypothetical protein
MRQKITTLPLLLAAIVLMFGQVLFAQQAATSASMSGTITDTKGGTLPGATVIAVHVPSGTQYGTTTRTDGRYNLTGLRVGGPYEVTVSYVGYQTQKQTVDKLVLGQDYSLNIQLVETSVELGAVTIVSDKTAIINNSRTGSAQNVSSKQMSDIPSISRTFATFAKMSPMFSGLNYQAAGRSNRYNNIQIDGTQYNDLFGLGSTGTPGGQTGTNPISLDAIQEFQVVIAPYDVRLSGFTGSGINAITRSGTNEFHGSAYGYGRNQDLVGKNYNGANNPVSDFKAWAYGFDLGGPIQKDKIFFFLNGEITGYNQPTPNLSLTTGPAGVASTAQTIQDTLLARGLAIGSSGPYNAQQPSGKIFARLDFNLSDNHKLSLHYNYVNARQDILAYRGASTEFSWDSYLYQIRSETNNTVAQLNSTFGNNMTNELIVGYTTIRDKRGPQGTLTPEVQVREGGVTYEMGTDRYSSANRLDQNVLEITDNFTYYAGDHTFTIGTHNEFFTFTNLFLRSFAGYYQYNSLHALQIDSVAQFQQVLSLTSDPSPAAHFAVNQYGFYIQDDWQVMPTLRLSLGLRVDDPTYPDKPLQNPNMLSDLNINTATAPSGNLLWAPRLGFNWDVNGDRTTQVRGGIGIFAGRPAYVWISNQFGNSGMLQYEVDVYNHANFPFQPDASKQPGLNAPGAVQSLTSEIDISDPNLKMPQIARFDLGVDHQLPWGMIGTVDFQYTKTVNDFYYQEMNLGTQKGDLIQDGRPVYFSDYSNGNGTRNGVNSYNGHYTNIMYLVNTSQGYTYNLTAQVQKTVARGFSFNAGYSYGKAMDLNSVNSSQAFSQMRYNPISGDPNNPALTPSQYEIRDRVFASVTYTDEFFKNAPTTISIFYNGEDGAPYSFIYGSDINGDGFDQNDLFYIPKNNNDIELGRIVGGVYQADQSMYTALNNFIDNNSYLSSHRGQIAGRNADRNPWVTYIDFQILQDIPIIEGHHLQLSYTIQNLGNLINSDWGWNSSVFSTYKVAYKAGVDPATHQNVYTFNAPANNTPFTPSYLSSRWSMQLGLRYSF